MVELSLQVILYHQTQQESTWNTVSSSVGSESVLSEGSVVLGASPASSKGSSPPPALLLRAGSVRTPPFGDGNRTPGEKTMWGGLWRDGEAAYRESLWPS